MNCIDETWKDIPGYENLYQISDQGRVKSLKFGKEKVLKPGLGSDGYCQVQLFKNGEMKNFRVHRLVSLVFIPNPDNKPFVDHINGIKNDNSVKNLRWCTHKENMNFPLVRKNISQSQINNPKKSKAILQIDINTREVINEFPSIRGVERQLGIASTNISKCCNGKLKTAYGYIWRYK